MSNQPKIIGYGLIFHHKGIARSFFGMDDVMKVTLDRAEEEAYALRDKELMGMFSMDDEGNFATIYNKAELRDLVEGMELDNMSEGEKTEQRAIDAHNARHGTTL